MDLPRAPKFRPNQEIICVDDDFKKLLSALPYVITPKKTDTYTVRDIFWIASLGVYAITLNELKNDLVFDERIGHFEPNWNENRFIAKDEIGDWESYVESQIKEILEPEKELLI